MGNEDKSKSGALRVIRHALGRKRKTFGHGFEAAYHTITLDGEEIQGQRDISTRLDHVDYDFKDKVVMDVGCNMGGMLHELSSTIEYGIGVDYNAKVINAANIVKACNKKDNIHFYTFDLTKEPLDLLGDYALGHNVDICFILSMALWVGNWKDVVTYCHGISDALLYESNGKDKFQEDQFEFLKTLYSSVKLMAEKSDDDNREAHGAKLRKLYLCRKG